MISCSMAIFLQKIVGVVETGGTYLVTFPKKQKQAMGEGVSASTAHAENLRANENWMQYLVTAPLLYCFILILLKLNTLPAKYI